MSRIRVCFLGTPEFALVSLKSLVSDKNFEVVGVITQPDRPAGRKLQLTPSAVKTYAMAQGLRVISPSSLKSVEIQDEIRQWGAEIAVVVAFGQILSDAFLQIFPLGAVNVHGSVLPRWRGAAPIQRAIQFGDSETGVTLQKIVRELDAGDIIGIRKTAILPTTDAKQLYAELANLGAQLLQVELVDFIRGNLAVRAQDVSQVTIAKKIDKSEALIHWSETAQAIHNKVRAFNMGPGTWTTVSGLKVKIHKTAIMPLHTEAHPGTVLEATPQKLVVATGEGALSLLELQPESRNRMAFADFLKGSSLKKGDLFG